MRKVNFNTRQRPTQMETPTGKIPVFQQPVSRLEYFHHFGKAALELPCQIGGLRRRPFRRAVQTAFIASLTAAWLRFGTCTATSR